MSVTVQELCDRGSAACRIAPVLGAVLSVWLLAAHGGAQERPLEPLGPMPEPFENPLTPEKALLGKFLFWEEQLSSDDAVACGTCHLPFAGGADPRAREATSRHPGPDGEFGTVDDRRGSVGVVRQICGGGPVDDGTFFPLRQVTGRRAPSAIAAGYAPDIFWDGRARSMFVDPETDEVAIISGGGLESQAVGPILSGVEMACDGRGWDDVRAKLATVTPMALAQALPLDMAAALVDFPTYPDLFTQAFGTPEINARRIAFAIASYERTLVPDQTPFDRFLAGDTMALTPDQQAGWELFQEHCLVCHAGTELSDHDFHNIGVRPAAEDPGRFAVTSVDEDRGRFKTPGLRNVALRAPFFHNGGKADLVEVLIFYNEGGEFEDNLDEEMFSLELNNDELAQIIDFLTGALTDPRVEDELFPFSRPQLQPYFLRGDSNRDGVFSLLDGLHVLNYVFLGVGPALCKDASDANDDGVLSLLDGIAMLERLFLGGPPLPLPGDDSFGPDPTPDTLDCRP